MQIKNLKLKKLDTMSFDKYKFVLETCASSENEVTGEDIEHNNRFECDLKGVNLKEGVCLFSPKRVVRSSGFEQTIFPDFNFKVLEVHKDGIVLETSFQYSSYSSQFKISYAEPKHCETFWFGRYCYSYELTFVNR